MSGLTLSEGDLIEKIEGQSEGQVAEAVIGGADRLVDRTGVGDEAAVKAARCAEHGTSATHRRAHVGEVRVVQIGMLDDKRALEGVEGVIDERDDDEFASGGEPRERGGAHRFFAGAFGLAA